MSIRLFLFSFFLGLISFSQDTLFPRFQYGELVKHHYFTLSYAEAHEQAYWVFYELTKEEIGGTAERTDDFREDTLVSTGSATLADYKGSGYDRGHIAPAADMAFNNTAMSESFYFSNMSPQHPSFNRGYWKKLEAEVRNWAYDRGQLFVASGPVLVSEYEQIGPNKVSIPEFYYKVLLDTVKRTTIAFLMPNIKCKGDLMDYVVTVDSLEHLTGIDFNAHLPDSIEQQIEAKDNKTQWSFATVTIEKKSKTDHSDENSSKQCKATTNSGTRCSRKTSDPSGFCWQHD